MPSDRDEVNRELDRRRAQRQQREAQRRKAEKARRALLFRLALVGVVILLVSGLILAFALGGQSGEPTTPGNQETMGNQETPGNAETPGHSEAPVSTTTPGTEPASTTAPQTEPETAEATQPTEQAETTTIHIAAAGDLNVTDKMIQNAMTSAGYDFTDAFLDVAPVLGQADLTILNYEGTFGGTEYGTSTGAAPGQLAQAMAAIGVDAVQTANSASIRSGVLGLQSTIQALQNAGIQPIGTFSDSKSFRSCGGFTMMEVKGLRIALVGFTKGMDNLGLPEGSEDCVNLLYTDYTSDYSDINSDGIRKVLKNVAEEQPDLTIAMVHWGSEYNEAIHSTQVRIKNLMLENGVDIILGTHSHLLKTIEFDQEDNTLVAYSLGDFYGDADQAGSNYSIILDIQVTRDNLTGETTIDSYDYTPIYILKPEDSAAGGQRVVRIQEAMARYEGGFLGRVTDSVYENMEYVLTRIEERIAEEVN